MKDKNIRYYKQELLETYETEELDFIFQGEIGFDHDTHVTYIDITEDTNQAEGHVINIDTLLNKLNEMKQNGATHVTVDYHVDHFSYIIDSWKVSNPTENEIEEYIKSSNEKYMERLLEKKRTFLMEIDRLDERIEKS